MQHIHRRSRARRHLALLAALVFAACDLPTGPPKWETEWQFPGESTRITVAELLPSSLRIAPGGQEFELSIPAVTSSHSLGEICGAACDALDGRAVPKPPFAYTFTTEFELPAEVVAAALSSGSVEVALQHEFPFDPLRPPGSSATGTITARVLNGLSVLGTVTVSGATTAFPANLVLTRSIPLAASTISGPLRVELTLSSPAGSTAQPVVIDTSDRLVVTATPVGLRLRSGDIEIVNQPVTIEPVDLELDGIDPFVVRRAQRGAMILSISNPFTVAGMLTFRFDTPSGPITKPVPIAAGESTVRIEFTGPELQRILGSGVRLSASGSISGTGPSVRLEPAQVLVLQSRIEVTVSARET